MSAAIYAKPSDEVGHSATVSLVVGTANSNYPVTNVQQRNPIDVFLTTDTVGVRIVWDHGAATVLQGFSLHHHNIPAGTSGVKIQRNATNAWGAPSFSNTLTIQTYPNTGLPLPIGVDLRPLTTASLRYSSLLIPAIGSPGQLTGLGAVCWWRTLRDDIENVSYPASDSEQGPRRVFKTAYGNAKEYRLGVRLRTHPSTFLFKSFSKWRLFQSLVRDCNDGPNVFLWWRDTSSSDAFLARFDEDTLSRQMNPLASVSVQIEELANGVALPTAA